ncbi:MAG TPA: hypothetical protein VFS37_01045 [Conexibacter sp.]|nr:hypothetical protein [Conexibacter sp.]
MNKYPFILSTIAVAVLAGCATEHRVSSAPAPVIVGPAQQAPSQAPYVLGPSGTVVQPQAGPVGGTVVVAPAPVALRSGFGRIESILAVPNAAAGGTGATHRRVVMRMEDGSVQYFDTTAADVAVGQRIEITKDGMMRQAS